MTCIVNSAVLLPLITMYSLALLLLSVHRSVCARLYLV